MTSWQRNQIRNHPKKGAIIKADPIRSLVEVKKIKRQLADNPRNYAIFVLGINTALRASDIVKLKKSEVANLKPGDHFTIRMKKTNELLQITFNEEVVNAVKPLLIDDGSEFLFPSEKTGKAMTVQHLGSLVKGWCKDAGLKGRYSSHSLRKTFGHIQYTHFKTPIAVLQKIFGHKSEYHTFIYLCIQPEDVKDAFLNII